jgi:hypothetical protein
MQIIDLQQMQQCMDTGHTKGSPYMVGIKQGKETKSLNVVDVLTKQEWI